MADGHRFRAGGCPRAWRLRQQRRRQHPRQPLPGASPVSSGGAGRAREGDDDTVVARFLPEASQEQWRSFDELQQRSTSPDNAWRFVGEFADIDVTNLAPRLTVPTLIMCSRREPGNRFEQSRLLAALIPNSRLVPLDSSNHLLPERDPAWKHFLAEIDRFLPGRQ